MSRVKLTNDTPLEDRYNALVMFMQAISAAILTQQDSVQNVDVSLILALQQVSGNGVVEFNYSRVLQIAQKLCRAINHSQPIAVIDYYVTQFHELELSCIATTQEPNSSASTEQPEPLASQVSWDQIYNTQDRNLHPPDDHQ